MLWKPVRVPKIELVIISTVEDEEILKVEVEEILIKEEIVILNHPTKEKVKILLVRLIEEEVEVTTTKVGQILTTYILESSGIKLQIVDLNNKQTLQKSKMLVIILLPHKVYF